MVMTEALLQREARQGATEQITLGVLSALGLEKGQMPLDKPGVSVVQIGCGTVQPCAIAGVPIQKPHTRTDSLRSKTDPLQQFVELVFHPPPIWSHEAWLLSLTACASGAQ